MLLNQLKVTGKGPIKEGELLSESASQCGSTVSTESGASVIAAENAAKEEYDFDLLSQSSYMLDLVE